MKPIDPAELSGLLDGELTAARAQEVRQAFGADPQLRASYDALCGLDDQLQRCAAAIRFEPGRPVIARPARRGGWLVAVVILLVAIRAASKLSPPLVGNLLEATALLIALAWFLLRLYKASDQDCWPALVKLATDDAAG